MLHIPYDYIQILYDGYTFLMMDTTFLIMKHKVVITAYGIVYGDSHYHIVTVLVYLSLTAVPALG